ncbi:MAG: hypothetical protein OHK93_002721 [Ramalina farinacea]|uniref:Uncharacterized protein n=1 Tax=Ramalina farinacea TaxID=258253 RepID=A0AA43QSQ8_9LECA|nr:hypothetical protein [Ramalina farinacea]
MTWVFVSATSIDNGAMTVKFPGRVTSRLFASAPEESSRKLTVKAALLGDIGSAAQ